MKAELNREIAQAFATDLKDAVKPFKATRTINEYTTDSDWGYNMPPQTSVISYTGKGVFARYKAIEIDDQAIKANDVKLMALQSQVTKKPELDDVIEGKQVIAIQQDPIGVVWIIQLRGAG